MEILFTERLKQFREQHSWTQEELGKKINVSGVTINRYEKGLRNPDPKTLVLLADIFKTSVDFLLGCTDEIKPYRQKATEPVYVLISDLPEGTREQAAEYLEFLKRKVK